MSPPSSPFTALGLFAWLGLFFPPSDLLVDAEMSAWGWFPWLMPSSPAEAEEGGKGPALAGLVREASGTSPCLGIAPCLREAHIPRAGSTMFSSPARAWVPKSCLFPSKTRSCLHSHAAGKQHPWVSSQGGDAQAELRWFLAPIRAGLGQELLLRSFARKPT